MPSNFAAGILSTDQGQTRKQRRGSYLFKMLSVNHALIHLCPPSNNNLTSDYVCVCVCANLSLEKNKLLLSCFASITVVFIYEEHSLLSHVCFFLCLGSQLIMNAYIFVWSLCILCVDSFARAKSSHFECSLQ